MGMIKELFMAELCINKLLLILFKYIYRCMYFKFLSTLLKNIVSFLLLCWFSARFSALAVLLLLCLERPLYPNWSQEMVHGIVMSSTTVLFGADIDTHVLHV